MGYDILTIKNESLKIIITVINVTLAFDINAILDLLVIVHKRKDKIGRYAKNFLQP